VSQVQKKLKISELSQDEDFFKDLDVPETPSEGPFSQDFPQMFQEIMDNLKDLMPPKKAEDWEDIDWESHEPTHDPSPFESIEWEQLPLPPVKIGILMRAFTKSGYSCLIVGGAVRDLMLGLEPKDYDLATDATPDEVKEVVNGLKGYRYVLGPQAEKSILNLTSLVTVPNETEAVEITTFRKELGYAGGRTKGEFVPAKTFTEDSERRDLTINAMGMTVDGILIDPQNGKEDLQNGVIRAVGDPTRRFVEDPLRMIRAIRFSVRFGLPIENETWEAIVSNADLVSTLSGRRLRDEIGKVIIEPNGYQMLMESGILPTLMPEFGNMKDYHHKLDYHPEGSLYNHYIEAFKKYTTIENRSELGAWALLFHDIAKPQTAEWNEDGGFHTFYGHDKQGAKLVLDNYNNEVGPFEFSKKELQSIAWTTDNHLGRFWEMTKPMKVSAMRNNENWPMLVEVVTGDTMGIRRGGDEQLAARIEQINEITKNVNEQKAKTGNRPPGFAKQVIQELNVKNQEISIALNQIEELVSTGVVNSYDEALRVLKSKRQSKNAEPKHLLTGLDGKTSMGAEGRRGMRMTKRLMNCVEYIVMEGIENTIHSEHLSYKELAHHMHDSSLTGDEIEFCADWILKRCKMD